jgi:fatty acid desaturase
MPKNKIVAPGRFPRGFSFTHYERALLRTLCQTSLARSIIAILADWSAIVLCILSETAVYQRLGLGTAIVGILLLCPLIARSQRGLENLTHEASHQNLTRVSRKMNDTIADWLFASWVLNGVRSFRATHTIHHALFGSPADPDRVRFDELGLDDLPRGNPLQMAGAVCMSMPAYVRGYWSQFKARGRVLIKAAICHAAAACVIQAVFGSTVLVVAATMWWLAFLLYLPILRFIAEAEEHRYVNYESEYAATYSNLGWLHRMFFHPHGDGYHLAHHLCPQVPHWRLSTANLALTAMNDKFRGGMVRKSIFADPKAVRSTDVASHSDPIDN